MVTRKDDTSRRAAHGRHAGGDTRSASIELIPAIDLLGGRVVRLARGEYGAVTSYDDDPVSVARRWQAEGATRLHIVDLDGAREGRPVQAQVVADIIAAVDVPCQVAGGLRTETEAASMLGRGADRVVLGSALISDPTMAGRLVGRHGAEHIVAAIDVRAGRALGDGWVDSARGTEAGALAQTLATAGVRWFAVTAIARDGLMSGPDLELLGAIGRAVPRAAIIASGGVSGPADVRALAREGYAAAILGRALYEGALTLAAARDAALGD
ncbi:1-(5-phosphoribosyl)-5-[(5-phosphoribosylamino)methylideneamino]imidazole-4-carboxamide isomerase [soil metagenome]